MTIFLFEMCHDIFMITLNNNINNKKVSFKHTNPVNAQNKEKLEN